MANLVAAALGAIQTGMNFANYDPGVIMTAQYKK